MKIKFEKISGKCFCCSFLGRLTIQHSTSNTAIYLCETCHQKDLNSQKDKVFNRLKTGKTLPKTIQVGEKKFGIRAGSVQIEDNLTQINFMPGTIVPEMFLEVQAKAKDYNQGEYETQTVVSGGNVFVSGGSPDGWAYVVGIYENY